MKRPDLQQGGKFLLEEFEIASRMTYRRGGLPEKVDAALSELRDCCACPRDCHVNRLEGCIDGGKARIGGMVFDIPANAPSGAGKAVVYIRPHHLDIDYQRNGANHFRARVVRVNPVGPLAKIELVSEWGDTVDAEIPPEVYHRLSLGKDAEVFVYPRQAKVYAQSDGGTVSGERN